MKQQLIKSLLVAIVACMHGTVFSQQIIRTIAGNGVQNYSGDGGPAILAEIGNVYGVAVNDSGYVYSCDNNFNNIRKITPNGGISTLTGNMYGGFSGDGGPATAALVNTPFNIAFDPHGNLHIADGANYVIRKVDTSEIITTVAGNHTTGYFNGNGIAALASKIGASGIAFDRYGNLYIADGNTRLRKVDLAGIITTPAGNGSVGFAGNGGQATNASFEGVVGVCVDTFGNIYIADKINNQVRKVNATTGIVSAYVGTSTAGFSGDGGQATACKLNGPNAVRIDPQGNVIVVDQNNNRIRKVNKATGVITTIVGSSSAGGFAGDGGPATAAVMAFPADVAWDRFGNMFIADKGQASTNNGHRIREVFNIDTLHLTVSPGDTICGFAHVTYTAHEMKGKHYLSFYKWKLNGTVVGGNLPYYYSDTVRNGDVITCSMYDTAAGGFTIAVSDTIRMTVRPVVIPGLTITSTEDTFCDGRPITLTAHGVNTGTSPVYKWLLFGSTLLGTGPTLTYAPHIGDIVTCRLISNAVCAYPDSISVLRTMIVNVSHPAIISLMTALTDTVVTLHYWGEHINLFSQLTFEGTHPTFQWYKNGVALHGDTTRTYGDWMYGNDTFYCVMRSDARCAVPDVDTSNKVIISPGRLAVSNGSSSNGNFSILPNPNSGSFNVTGTFGITNDDPVTLTVTDMLGRTVYQTHAAVVNGRLDAHLQPQTPLTSGMYLVLVAQDSGNEVLHFVVENK